MNESQPLVCAVCLTADRPKMLERAIKSFRAQTYKDAYKRLLVLDSGENPAWYWPVTHFLVPDMHGCTVGALRNAANWRAMAMRPDIIMHMDSDDWSSPDRMAEQVAVLRSSGADVVGYSDAIFYDERPGSFCAAYRFSSKRQEHVLGASLCYWRRAWEQKPFPDLTIGEDQAWVQGLKVAAVSGISGGIPRIVCSIHGGNTNMKAYGKLLSGEDPQFKRAPEFDKYARQAMEIR